MNENLGSYTRSEVVGKCGKKVDSRCMEKASISDVINDNIIIKTPTEGCGIMNRWAEFVLQNYLKTKIYHLAQEKQTLMKA